MITSIVVTGCYNIGMNSNKKIKINDNVLSVEKDIPFIRYRMESYEEKEFEYIKKMMAQFNLSTHLIEIKLNDNTKNVLEYLSTNIPNIAKYIYTDISDEDVERGTLSDTAKQLLDNIVDYEIDRYMLKDKSKSLDTVSAKKIIKDLCKEFSLEEDMFGICSSPLSFGEFACLTAVKARELMSIYSPIADVALPSANHQNMNCCGCIRYLVVSSDTEAPADAKNKTKSTSKDNTSENEEKKEKTPAKPKPKNTIQIGRFSL